MKRLIIIAAILIIKDSIGQNDKSYLSNRYSLERMGNLNLGTNPVLPGLPSAASEIMGDPYLKSSQSLGTLLLYNDQVFKEVYTKYDLIHDDFYFFTKQGIRVVAGTQVKSFVFLDSMTKKQGTYINAKEFKVENGVPLIGFFEILFDGKTALFKRVEAIISKANYNVALNVGRRDHAIAKQTSYYFLKDNITTVLPSKKITTIFGVSQEEVDRFIKTNQLSLKDERHLTLVFEYYNQITQ